MTTTDDINTCLSTYTDPTDQLNCIRIALGYPEIISITPPCSGITAFNRCISKNTLLIGSVAIIILLLISRE